MFDPCLSCCSLTGTISEHIGTSNNLINIYLGMYRAAADSWW